MPAELVEPLVGLGDVDGGSVQDAVGDFAVEFAVDDDGLVGVKVDGLLDADGLVEEGIHPEVGGSGEVFGSAVVIGDDEVFAVAGNEALQVFDALVEGEEDFGSGDDAAGSVAVPEGGGLAVFDGGGEEHDFGLLVLCWGIFKCEIYTGQGESVVFTLLRGVGGDGVGFFNRRVAEDAEGRGVDGPGGD